MEKGEGFLKFKGHKASDVSLSEICLPEQYKKHALEAEDDIFTVFLRKLTITVSFDRNVF